MAVLPSGNGLPIKGACSRASQWRLTRRVTQYSILVHIIRAEGLSLTPAGARLVVRVAPLWRAAERGFRQTVGPDEAGRLRRLVSGAMPSLST